jgi:hypothetical protein
VDRLILDGVNYYSLDTDSIPPGAASVDIKIDDNGNEYPAAMVAGLVASRVDNSKDASLSDTGECDVISPVPGWWMFLKKGESYKERVPDNAPRVLVQQEVSDLEDRRPQKLAKRPGFGAFLAKMLCK